MKRAAWLSFVRFLATGIVALVLAAALGGCSLPSFSSHATTTATTVAAGPAETQGATTTTRPPQKITTTTSSSTTSTTLRPTTTSSSTTSTTTAVAALHVTKGDAKAISKRLKPSVVGVTAITRTTSTMVWEQIGTGVIYSATPTYAYIVTCNHVIERDDGSAAKRIRVTLASGSTVTATLVGRDPGADLAVLRVKARKQAPAIFRTDLSVVSRGDFVVAIGNAKILAHPVTSGNITGVYEDVSVPSLPGVYDVIASTAPLDHGNSGGPLVDATGQVLGINRGEFVDTGDAETLPSDLVAQVVKKLMATSD